MRAARLLSVAVIVSAVSGCAGPWMRAGANLPLPAASAKPTALQAMLPSQKTLPHVEQELREQAARELGITTSGLDTLIDTPKIDTPKNDTPKNEPADSGKTTVDTESGPETPGEIVPPEITIRGQSPAEPDRAYGSGVGTSEKSSLTYATPPKAYESDYGPVAPSSEYVGEPSYQSPVYAPGTFGDTAEYNGGYGPNQTNYDGSGIAAQQLPTEYADLVVNLREAQTGRFMFGVGVNSDLGLSAQAIIDERNFDWRRWPRSLDDIFNGTAWRGGGQSLRIEAVPGTEFQRYMVNFVQPYLFDTPISFNLSGYLFDRRYFDWDEQRLGGRMGLGYRITPDLSVGVSLRGEQVDLKNVRVRGIPEVEEALGKNDLYSGRISLTHNTRDNDFVATQGHFLELSFEQVFGSFDYSRGNVDYRRYYLLKERADGSGRHTLSFGFRGGVTGAQTPVYENFFAGGYSTLRGFRFRHASPKVSDVIVGGNLSLLGSVEYIFPVTADDMLKGALFCDYGTIEEEIDDINGDDMRVSIGAGLRINVPAMGPAPIAVDFAIPIAREDTDRIQNFSFFMGMMRP